jgi:hypothetical protein
MKCILNSGGKPSRITRRKWKDNIIIINVGDIKFEDERRMDLSQNLAQWRTSLQSVLLPGS